MPNENSRRPVVGATVRHTSAPRPEAAARATQRELDEVAIVEDYIATLTWSADTPHDVRGLVAGNLRGFFSHLRTRGLVA